MTERGHYLKISRTIPAPRDEVFRAWIDPAEMRRWFSPMDATTPHAESDARVDGRWRIGMQPPEGEVLYVSGTYREIEPPERLVFTWSWEPGSPAAGSESVVTVEFRAVGDETEVTVIHELLASPEDADRHREGWEGCLESLARALG